MLSAIAAWTDSVQPEGRARPLSYYHMAITAVWMIKRVFSLTLCTLQSFVDSIFKIIRLPQSISLPFQQTDKEHQH